LLAPAVHQHEARELAAAEVCRGLYRRVIESDPAHPDALHLLGLIAQATGDFTRAAAGIRKVLALCPDEAVFHYNLANVLRDAGQEVTPRGQQDCPLPDNCNCGGAR